MRIENTIVARLGLVAGALLLGACTVMPTGPTALVMPGRGATMDKFRFDDNECRQYAYIRLAA